MKEKRIRAEIKRLREILSGLKPDENLYRITLEEINIRARELRELIRSEEPLDE